jgi:ubiquinone/menaquinone biosynthesis C-methylase UbiE
MEGSHADRFNAAALNYYTDRYPGRAQCMRRVLELLQAQPDDVILDVGCGPGTQLIALSRVVRYGYGLDPAVQMIEKAELSARDCSNVRFLVGSTEALPPELHGAGINKIISNYALHHLPNSAKGQSIRNLASLLPKNGTMILGDLMFSDNPANHKELFELVGYGPGCDTPAKLPWLEAMFVEAGLTPFTHILNPLVAVIVGEKT